MTGIVIPTAEGGLVWIHGEDPSGDPQLVQVDAAGNLQIDVLTSALPSGAATAAKQDTMITALQLIDDLRAALGSVDTDDLQVDVKTSALPTGAATETTLSSLLTELQAKLETADLNLDVAGDLQVDVLSSALPTGAATSTKQDTMITALQLIDDLRGALHSVATDELDVDVQTSVLPTGAATSARQDTMITALQLIDDLRTALASVATDQLRTDIIAALPAGSNLLGRVDSRDGDKLFGITTTVAEKVEDTNASAGFNWLIGTSVPSGEFWVVTFAECIDIDNAPSSMDVIGEVDTVRLTLEQDKSPTANAWLVWNGELVLSPGDHIRAAISGVTAGDEIRLRYGGYKMTEP